MFLVKILRSLPMAGVRSGFPPVTTLCVAPVLGGVLALGVGTAFAGTGTIRLSWDGCDPIVTNACFTGEGSGQIVTLVVSLIGCDLANNGHRVKILIGPNVEDAWRFDADGCQAGRLQITHDEVEPSCPAFQGDNPLGLSQYSYDWDTGTAKLDVTNTYDEFIPIPSQRYTLWQVHFDHSQSAAGSTDPALACGFADNPLLFYLITVPSTEWELLLTDSSKRPFEGFDNEELAWEWPGVCPVQVVSRTWGRMKALYR